MKSESGHCPIIIAIKAAFLRRFAGSFSNKWQAAVVTHISDRQSQFSYFNQQLEGVVWKGSKILDFGGNVGGFLISAGNHVDHDDYWCLDVTRDAIAQGQREFPRAHFVHYDRYSSYFNWSLSDPELPAGTGVIVEMFEPQVATVSAALESAVTTSSLPGWCIAVDDELHFEPSDELCQQERSGKADESYCSYFTADYMASLFPTAAILRRSRESGNTAVF